MDFAVPADHRVTSKENKKDKYLNFTKELKKTMEHESDVYSNYNWCSWYSHRRIIKGTGGLGNKRTIGDHPNYSIIEKSPGDSRRLAVTQTTVKNSQGVNDDNRSEYKKDNDYAQNHPSEDDRDKLYVLRKEERRGHASIGDSVDASIRRLED